MQFPYRFGRYMLAEKIAAGGTAEVYRAFFTSDSGFTRPVAVKRLLPLWCGNEELRELITDEANVLVHLQHQSIVSVFELGEEENVPFIAMEFVDGIDCARLLNDAMRDRAPVPPAIALHMITQVLIALDFAHNCKDDKGRTLGIVHRDISPSNILCSWSGEVKVTDFGIAKGLHRSRMTTTGQLRGKFSYMAPEQAGGGEIDGRADVFACGILLFELLTAQRLFDADSDFEVIKKVKQAKLPQEAISSVPPSIRALLYLALARDVKGRYQSAREMLSDAQRAMRSLDLPAYSIELATFLREKYPEEAKRGFCRQLPSAGSKGGTKVMATTDASSAEAKSGQAKGWARRNMRANRFASIALLFGIILTSPSVCRIDAVEAGDPVASAAAVRPAGTLPPASGGTVAIDSRPSGAEGKLIIGDKTMAFKTPLALSDIAVGGGVDASIELSLKGYSPVAQKFRLTPAQPAFVKNFALKSEDGARLVINARPWGLAEVEGLVSERETPVSMADAKAGNYSVRVRFPPANQTLEKAIQLANGKETRCLATFGEDKKIECW